MYGVFSFIPFPEDIGRDTLNQVDLEGFVYDIHGQPVTTTIKIGLNKKESAYKEDFNLSGDEIETTSDEITGGWTFLLPDNYFMPPDSYYRLTLNDVIFRKFLPDFPPRNSLNQLEDY